MPTELQMVLSWLQSSLAWVYPVLILLALFASIRHIRLAKASPLLVAGFALNLGANILSRILTTLVTSHLPMTTSHSFSGRMPLYTTFYLLSSLGSICGWVLIAYGLYSVLDEVSEKLALLQIAPHNNWNHPTSSNSLQGQRVQNQTAQSPFIQPQQIQHHQDGQEQFREEAHATAFLSPASPAPSAQDGRFVLSVQPELPDTPLTLGSSQ